MLKIRNINNSQGAQHKIIYSHRIHDIDDNVNGSEMIHLGINSSLQFIVSIQKTICYLLWLEKNDRIMLMQECDIVSMKTGKYRHTLKKK